MGTVTYRDGIAILQLVVFPFILGAAIFIWSRAGLRVGSKIWRYPVTLSLIRIAGSIASLLSIKHDSKDVEIAIAVCELIGLAPLLLTYVGVLRQIDINQVVPVRWLNIVSIVGIIGLIIGIAGVSTASDDGGSYQPSNTVKASMAIFIALFVVYHLLAAFMYLQMGHPKAFQKKLFLAIILSTPFILVRVVYAAIGDFTTIERFSIISTNGSPTIYLVMDVLEEIVAMAITMVLGMSAVLEPDFVRLTPAQLDSEPKAEVV
ncbi:hypothetical protein ASPTUDRAFT_154831 [Aspergillus tubingensis CBS 134.48]|uniref:DUF7702 domain-containing protein n=1 Tax=Aspergillus tubingensis (strain CBS 134.48) TaxID=767770 RepID=A0A1L9MTX5_ASPTC|nr:hypothetical protein ASPTUDRAFT_154831 [Aspergillus tubingensis CBS 134.48]